MHARVAQPVQINLFTGQFKFNTNAQALYDLWFNSPANIYGLAEYLENFKQEPTAAQLKALDDLVAQCEERVAKYTSE